MAQVVEQALSVDTIVLDFGNTLWGSADAINGTWELTVPSFGIDPKTFVEAYHARYFQREGSFGCREKTEWVLDILGRSDVVWSEPLGHFRQRYREACLEDLKTDPKGTWSSVKLLSERYEVGVLSDNSEDTKEQWLGMFEDHGLGDVFSFFITSEAVGALKPDIRMFNSVDRVRQRTGKKVYFGNNLELDAPSADHGYGFVYVYGFDRGEPHPHYRSIEFINQKNLKRLGLLE